MELSVENLSSELAGAGIEPERLARFSGYSKGHINRIINGKRRPSDFCWGVIQNSIQKLKESRL